LKSICYQLHKTEDTSITRHVGTWEGGQSLLASLHSKQLEKSPTSFFIKITDMLKIK